MEELYPIRFNYINKGDIAALNNVANNVASVRTDINRATLVPVPVMPPAQRLGQDVSTMAMSIAGMHILGAGLKFNQRLRPNGKEIKPDERVIYPGENVRPMTGPAQAWERYNDLLRNPGNYPSPVRPATTPTTTPVIPGPNRPAPVIQPTPHIRPNISPEALPNTATGTGGGTALIGPVRMQDIFLPNNLIQSQDKVVDELIDLVRKSRNTFETGGL